MNEYQIIYMRRSAGLYLISDICRRISIKHCIGLLHENFLVKYHFR